jgi:hypothetical protein
MDALRQKWLGEFQKAVGTKAAVRVMQIDRLLRRCEWSEWRTGASLAPVVPLVRYFWTLTYPNMMN